MLMVLALAAGLWGLGAVIGAPRGQRAGMIAVLLAGVLAMQLVLPDGHALREATGGSPAPWLLIGGFGLLALGYGSGVRVLQRMAEGRARETRMETPAFTNSELDRYARHIVLREIGGDTAGGFQRGVEDGAVVLGVARTL